ncbi:hypothetical protein AB0J86_00185 [Micromonospora sp. NPDC049559]|uniref:hypothetical protein n=1 Tax=Micromonospora sp. NPDC049559 TaxID=3155923 RepID=UPI003441C0B3
MERHEPTRLDMRTYLERYAPLAPGAAAAFGRELAERLAERHADGRVQGPVESILVDVDEADGTASPVLTDPDPGPEPGPAPAGWAPADDVFCVGVVLAYLLGSGLTPQGEAPPRPATVPEPLWSLVAEALRPDPVARPAAAALAERLGETADRLDEDPSAYPAAAGEPEVGFGPDGTAGALRAPTQEFPPLLPGHRPANPDRSADPGPAYLAYETADPDFADPDPGPAYLTHGTADPDPVPAYLAHESAGPDPDPAYLAYGSAGAGTGADQTAAMIPGLGPAPEPGAAPESGPQPGPVGLDGSPRPPDRRGPYLIAGVSAAIVLVVVGVVYAVLGSSSGGRTPAAAGTSAVTEPAGTGPAAPPPVTPSALPTLTPVATPTRATPTAPPTRTSRPTPARTPSRTPAEPRTPTTVCLQPDCSARVTFQPQNGHLIVCDERKDGFSAIGIYSRSDVVPTDERRVWNSDAVGSCVDRDLELPKGIKVTFKACIGERPTLTVTACSAPATRSY